MDISVPDKDELADMVVRNGGDFLQFVGPEMTHFVVNNLSHAKLSIAVDGIAEGNVNEDFQVDVYGIYYNWLSIKDGRGMLSFA